MKSLIVIFGVLLFPCTALAAPVLSEICWMGSDVSTADEWFEITNPDDEAYNISGWSVMAGANKDSLEAMVRFSSGSVIRPGESLVVANYKADSSRLAEEPYLVDTDVSLSNSKLFLALQNANGEIVDAIDDGVGVPFAGQNASGTGVRMTMERIDLAASGEDPSNWRNAVQSTGFDIDAPMLGTPGFFFTDAQSTSSASSSSMPIEEDEASSENKKIPGETYIRISEIMANPVGSDSEEWVEVANFGTGSVNIAGWKLRVGTSEYTIPAIADSGTILGPLEFTGFRKTTSGLPLTNVGNTVSLHAPSGYSDVIDYPSAEEGISFGRLNQADSPRMLCKSTFGSQNLVRLPEVQIDIQSVSDSVRDKNSITAQDSLTLNLEGVVTAGSESGGQCSWSFGDGFTTSSCNPPSHTFKQRGIYSILFVFQDACGSVAEATLIAEVRESSTHADPKEKSVSKESKNEVACVPKAMTGVSVVQFVPNPIGADEKGESITVRNTTNKELSLCGWLLDDGEDGSTPFALDTIFLEANAELILSRELTGIALNNDTDEVRLLSPSGLAQNIHYSDAKEGYIFAIHSGSWIWMSSDSSSGASVLANQNFVRSFTGSIRIAELYPRPLDGEEEWIELVNEGSEVIHLAGWILDDVQPGGSRPWIFPDDVKIAAHSSLVIRRSTSGVALNDSGDEASLITPNGQVHDAVSYKKLAKGESIVFMGNESCISIHPSPGTVEDCIDKKSDKGLMENQNYEQNLYTNIQRISKNEIQEKYVNLIPWLHSDSETRQLPASHKRLLAMGDSGMPSADEVGSSDQSDIAFITLLTLVSCTLLYAASIRA